MKKIIYTFVANFLAFGVAFSQVPSSCVPTSQLLSAYQDDVNVFAWRTYTTDSTHVSYPSTYTLPFWQDLAAIANAPLSESVIVYNQYCIHNRPTVSLYSVIVTTSNNTAWSDSWVAGSQSTGITAIDTFTANHNLTVIYDALISQAVGYRVFNLQSPNSFNPNAVIKYMKQQSGVLYSEPNGIYGDGDNISVTDNGTYRSYAFSIGWGDCPAGCTERHYWYFDVDNNCNVTYTGELHLGGTMPQPGTPCNIITDIKNIELNQAIAVFPNPAADFITIEVPSDELYDGTAVLYNSTGQKIITLPVTQRQTIVSITDFPVGLYFIGIYSNGNLIKMEKVQKGV